jgi:predicted nuclease with TOPRIM domain
MVALSPFTPEGFLMTTIAPTQPVTDAYQVLASAVAHQVERMSKDEVQTLLAKAMAEIQKENAVLKTRIEQLEAKAVEYAQTINKLEADKVRLYYKIAHLSFDPEEFERTFDPSEYTVPVEQMMANARRRLQEP